MHTVPTPATTPIETRPIVRAAVSALDAFGAVNARQARTLLTIWGRRDQLTALDVEHVIAHYLPTGGAR